MTSLWDKHKEGEKEMLESEEKKWVIIPLAFVQELKKASSIAAPMVVVSILQYLLQVVSIIMVGHLGELSLSGVAIATSLTNVTGFSLLVSLSPIFTSLEYRDSHRERGKSILALTHASLWLDRVKYLAVLVNLLHFLKIWVLVFDCFN